MVMTNKTAILRSRLGYPYLTQMLDILPTGMPPIIMRKPMLKLETARLLIRVV
jgi:hypothetical protein